MRGEPASHRLARPGHRSVLGRLRGGTNDRVRLQSANWNKREGPVSHRQACPPDRARGRQVNEIPPTSRGYDAREVVSALQKSIRRSDPDAALYWGVELARSGYGAWLWKRLRIIAVEDC